VALQGDLHSFALADVLRLLAGTSKSGRLDVAGDAGNGEIWFEQGNLVGGEVTTSPHASRSADVIFEMLRFENGTFRFDEGSVPPDTSEEADVDDVIAAAEGLVTQWAAVERVVPSVHSWVSLAEQIDTESVLVTADQWRLVAAIATGITPRLLGDDFEMTDLEASTRVKELVEAGLVDVGDVVEPASTPYHEPDHDSVDIDFSQHDDVFQLSAEDGPVVLESREDALLPEPLPGEGTSFVGELDELGTVDGRTYGAPATPELDEVFEPVGFSSSDHRLSDLDAEIFEPTDFTLDRHVPEPPVDAAPATAEPFMGEAFAADALGATDEPAVPAAEELPDDEEAIDAAWSSYGSLDGVANDDSATGGYPMSGAEEGGPADGTSDDPDDRGSLLRFLSSVKP